MGMKQELDNKSAISYDNVKNRLAVKRFGKKIWPIFSHPIVPCSWTNFSRSHADFQ